MTQYTKRVVDGYTAPGMMERIHRQTILYPSWLSACGDVDGLRVLDIGCGDGRSSRMLAGKGAVVTACDNSTEMIQRAMKTEEENPLGINYFFCDAAEILHYARTPEELRKFACGMSNSLRPGGRLAMLNTRVDHPVKKYDPWTGTSAEWVGKPFQDGSEVRISVHNQDGSLATSFSNFYWSEHAYRKVLEGVGFYNIRFTKARISDDGRNLLKERGWPVTAEELEDSMVLMVVTAEKR
jgi:SAM-dependent methyltransferase